MDGGGYEADSDGRKLKTKSKTKSKSRNLEASSAGDAIADIAI